VKVKNVKALISSNGKSRDRQNYGMSLSIWDHRMLLATRHRRTHPTLTPASKAGTRFTYPGAIGD